MTPAEHPTAVAAANAHMGAGLVAALACRHVRAVDELCPGVARVRFEGGWYALLAAVDAPGRSLGVYGPERGLPLHLAPLARA